MLQLRRIRADNPFLSKVHSLEQWTWEAESGKPLKGCTSGNPNISEDNKVPKVAEKFNPYDRIHTIKIQTQHCSYLRVNVLETVLKRTFELSSKAKNFCAKLALKYELAVVRKLLGKHCYELEDLTGKRLGVFYGKHLKKMHPPT